MVVLAGAIDSGGQLPAVHQTAEVLPLSHHAGNVRNQQTSATEIGTNMQIHLLQDWHLALGHYVEVKRNGRTARTGMVDEVMSDGSILWLAAAGVDSREMVERADGSEIYVRNPRRDPSIEGASKIRCGEGDGALLFWDCSV